MALLLLCSIGSFTSAGAAGIYIEAKRNRSPDAYDAVVGSGTELGGFVLRSRICLWFQQIFFFLVLVFAVAEGGVSVIEIASTILLCLSLVQSLLIDGVEGLPYPAKKKYWTPHYSLATVYMALLFVQRPGIQSFFGLVFAVAGLGASAVGHLLPVQSLQANKPPAEYTAGILYYLSFAYLNKILIKPKQLKETFEIDDVPTMCDDDSLSHIFKRFSLLIQAQGAKENINIVRALFLMVQRDWLHQGCFQLLSSCSTTLAPIGLSSILYYIANVGASESAASKATSPLIPSISVYFAVVLLFSGPLIRSVGDGQNYQRGRHIGIRVKAALIGAVYKKTLTADMAFVDTGKLKNLISKDVSQVQDFCAYTHFLWSTVLEMSFCITLLFNVLGFAAWGGIFVMLSSMYFGLQIGKRLEDYQEKLNKDGDARMKAVDEVLLGIRIIKSFAWEDRFLHKISEARKIELASLRNYVFTNAGLYVLWEMVPAMVAASAFVLHVYAFGRSLTPTLGFTALILFELLRGPLSLFPDIITNFFRSRLALRRIEAFLKTPDVKGLGEVEHITVSAAVSQMSNVPATTPRSFNSWSPHNPNKMTSKQVVVGGEICVLNGSVAWNVNDTNKSGESGTRIERGVEQQVEEEEEEEKDGCFASCRRLCSMGKNSAWLGMKRNSSFAAVLKQQPSTSPSPSSSPATSPRQQSLLSSMQAPASSPRYLASSHGESSHGLVRGLNTLADDEEDGAGSICMNPILSGAAAAATTNGHVALDVEMGNRRRSTTQPRTVLSGLNINILPGQLVTICGLTGSGKSSLLSALIGECLMASGSVKLTGTLSYVSQSPWIQNGSLRDNILFGMPFEEKKYKDVVAACALEADLLLLPKGDETEIGERGVNLSGGQKARVSLARAAYSDSNTVLLDDPLSAVDAHVGDHIFKELICKYLHGRTRVLVTHHVALAIPHSDLVVVLSDGKLVASCALPELPGALRKYNAANSDSNNANVIGLEINEDKSFLSFCDQLVLAAMGQEAGGMGVGVGVGAGAVAGSDMPSLSLPPNASGTAASLSRASSSSSSVSSITISSERSVSGGGGGGGGGGGKVATTQPKQQQQAVIRGGGGIIDVETKASGDVSWRVYWYYLKSCGGGATAFLLIGSCMWLQASQLLQSYGLGVWMQEMEKSGASIASKDAFYFYVLCGLSVLVATLSRAAMQLVGSLRGAKILHEKLIKSVTLSTCSWFDATPLGRINNRFSQDMKTVDSDTMPMLLWFLDTMLSLLQILGVIALFLPWLLFLIFFVVATAVFVARQYLAVSRDLKRLEAVHKSPVFTLLDESLSGLSVLRAFRAEKRFFDECCERVDAMNRCHLYLWLSNRWLNFRMQILGCVVAGLVGCCVVIEAKTIGSTAAGLALVYSLGFTDSLTYSTRAHAECQMSMNSVERISEYCELEPEKYIPKKADGSNTVAVQSGSAVVPVDSGVPAGWPSKGKIEFKNISLRYASSSSPVLRNVCFGVPGANKIGIVGRTGAGKSSLIICLFRTVEPDAQGPGSGLFIDGINVLNIPLHTLRSALSIVPQDPILFKGSVRTNLDPFFQETDEVLWHVLKRVHMDEAVSQMPGGTNQIGGSLDDKLITEGGQNLSQGQRQLLCMARAILRKNKVLVLDESTASVDHETDALIQETVQNSLSDCTVLTIAHRLKTVVCHDLIIVMDKGSVIEAGKPMDLLKNSQGQFFDMAQASGEYDQLIALAASTAASTAGI